MKKNKLFLLLMLAFLFSCEGEEIDYSIVNRSISVTARIDGVKTRAADDNWTNGDVIGIYMLAAGEALSNESVLTKNAKYSTTGDGFFTPTNAASEIKLPIDGSNVDFIAYYPQGTISAAYEYSIDVTKQEDPGAIDLMYADNAKNLNKSSNVVNFSFAHQLSKIIVNITNQDGSPLSDVTATIKGSSAKGKFSLIDKALTLSTKGNIKMKVSNSGNSAEAIVLPTENLTGITLEVTSGLAGYTHSLAALEHIMAFEPGYKYTFNVVLDNRESAIVGAIISNWNDGPSETITMPKEFDVYVPDGAGTLEDPFTIEDGQHLEDLTGVWVKGYIVGYYTSTSLGSFSNDIGGSVVDTKIALAAVLGETVGANTFPVQLPSGTIRNALNLKDNPGNLGKEVLIKGTLATYNGGPGINPSTDYQFVNP